MSHVTISDRYHIEQIFFNYHLSELITISKLNNKMLITVYIWDDELKTYSHSVDYEPIDITYNWEILYVQSLLYDNSLAYQRVMAVSTVRISDDEGLLYTDASHVRIIHLSSLSIEHVQVITHPLDSSSYAVFGTCLRFIVSSNFQQQENIIILIGASPIVDRYGSGGSVFCYILEDNTLNFISMEQIQDAKLSSNYFRSKTQDNSVSTYSRIPINDMIRSFGSRIALDESYRVSGSFVYVGNLTQKDDVVFETKSVTPTLRNDSGDRGYVQLYDLTEQLTWRQFISRQDDTRMSIPYILNTRFSLDKRRGIPDGWISHTPECVIFPVRASENSNDILENGHFIEFWNSTLEDSDDDDVFVDILVSEADLKIQQIFALYIPNNLMNIIELGIRYGHRYKNIEHIHVVPHDTLSDLLVLKFATLNNVNGIFQYMPDDKWELLQPPIHPFRSLQGIYLRLSVSKSKIQSMSRSVTDDIFQINTSRHMIVYKPPHSDLSTLEEFDTKLSNFVKSESVLPLQYFFYDLGYVILHDTFRKRSRLLLSARGRYHLVDHVFVLLSYALQQTSNSTIQQNIRADFIEFTYSMKVKEGNYIEDILKYKTDTLVVTLNNNKNKLTDVYLLGISDNSTSAENPKWTLIMEGVDMQTTIQKNRITIDTNNSTLIYVEGDETTPTYFSLSDITKNNSG